MSDDACIGVHEAALHDFHHIGLDHVHINSERDTVPLWHRMSIERCSMVDAQWIAGFLLNELGFARSCR